MDFDRALTGSFERIASFPEDEALVRANLAEVVRLDVAIAAAESRLKARVVGPITLNPGEVDALRDRARTFAFRIARALGVEVRGDAFDADKPSARATPWGMSGGGGNAQRQG